MSDYTLTQHDINLNIWISTGASAASFILCAAVLGAAAWVWSYPHFRMYLDRVSFRLLLWSMVFELAYDVAYIAVELYSFYGIDGGACGSGVYFMMAFMGIVNYLCTAIAVNLALTISFGMNPIRQRLERWYVGVSIGLGLFIPVVPACLGHFGFDPILHVCWITARSDELRLRNFILDLYMWQILSCIIATASVVMVLITLIRQSRATSAALYAGNKLNRDLLSSDDEDATQSGSGNMSKRKRKYLWARLSSFSTTSTSSSSRGSDAGTGSRPHRMSHTMSQLEDRFLRIALKISAYPVALIIVNVIITVGDLIISRDGGVYSRRAYALYCVYYFLYGGRGIVFAFLAFFIDPCLRFGLRAVLRAKLDPARSMPGIELESSRLDTMERSFIEMLAMPDPSTDPAAYDEDSRSKRAGRGLLQGRRAKSRPAALRLGRGMDGDDDVEKGSSGMRGTQSLPGLASLDFDSAEPGWGGLGGLEGQYGQPGQDVGGARGILERSGSVPRRASSTSSMDALKMKERDQYISKAAGRTGSNTSIDMPAALGELAYEAEHDRYRHSQLLHPQPKPIGQRGVSPRSTAPSTPNLDGNGQTRDRQDRRTSFHLPIKPTKAFASPRLGWSRPAAAVAMGRSPSDTTPNDSQRRASALETPASPSPSTAMYGQGATQRQRRSRSFVGVDLDDLPLQLTDTVDVRRPSVASAVPLQQTSPTRRHFAHSRASVASITPEPAPPQSASPPGSSLPTPTSTAHTSRTSTPAITDPTSRQATRQNSAQASCIALPRRASRASQLQLESLDPDLPNATEEAIRRIRAAREQKRQEKEAAIMAFLQTKAML